MPIHTEKSTQEAVAFATDVKNGLSRRDKRLSCAFLYDEEGSRLFEEICEVEEYYPTRSEAEILARFAPDICSDAPEGLTLVELGSGSSTKTRYLIEELLEGSGNLRYIPIDISPTILEASAALLLERYPKLHVDGLAMEYLAGLEKLAEVAPGPRLVIWLGSSIGNFTRSAAVDFLREVRSDLTPQDRMLVGIDLRKDARVLEAAYDDSEGVTERFSKNLLARINRELGGHFDLDRFVHRAHYHVEEGRIEITLESLCKQTVAIDRLEMEVTFEEGETIHTEDSFKYSNEEIEQLAQDAGFELNGQWMDGLQRFSVNRLRPV